MNPIEHVYEIRVFDANHHQIYSTENQRDFRIYFPVKALGKKPDSQRLDIAGRFFLQVGETYSVFVCQMVADVDTGADQWVLTLFSNILVLALDDVDYADDQFGYICKFPGLVKKAIQADRPDEDFIRNFINS
jgi:hypothetical protein